MITNKPDYNLFLVGPMGAGKSSIGRTLASLTHKLFYDSDKEIEQSTGVDISWIFEQEGEQGFRRRETSMLSKLSNLHNIILSTGGGSILYAGNRKLLSQNGIVVYLTVSIEQQLARTAHQLEKRPILSANSSKAQLQQLNALREPYYREVADLVLNTDDLTQHQIAVKILKQIKQLQELS